MQTYQGSCHCGRVRFEVDLDLDHVRVCDFSTCRQRGALIHRVEADHFRLLSPLQDLTLYQWHTRTAEDYFCPNAEFCHSGGRATGQPRRSPKLCPSSMDGPSMLAVWRGLTPIPFL